MAYANIEVPVVSGTGKKSAHQQQQQCSVSGSCHEFKEGGRQASTQQQENVVNQSHRQRLPL
jgi:hypothetical protein